jgi:ferredoxin
MDLYARLSELLDEKPDPGMLFPMFSAKEAAILARAGAGEIAEDKDPATWELYRSGHLDLRDGVYTLCAWGDILYRFLLSPRYARLPRAERAPFQRHFLERNYRRFREAEKEIFRVLPAGGTLAHLDLHVIVPYSVASEVLAQAGRVVLIDCVCRVTADNCQSPRDACMVLGDATDYYLERGLGRSLDQAEAGRVLARAAEAGLVHCTDNPAMRTPSRVICNCCACCCSFVRGLKEEGLSRTIAASGYVAVTDAASCDACGVCVSRCIFDAREIHGDAVRLITGRCLGCGQCVPACPTGAVRLEPGHPG